MRDLRNDVESVLISEEQLEAIVARIAAQIDRDYRDSDKKLVLVCILKGSLVFMGDLMKKLSLPLEIEAMKVSSYGSSSVSSGKINIQLDLNRKDLSNVDILIVEDIIDSGNTLSRICKHLKERGAASVRTCTMLDKPARREVDFVPDYCGKTIPDKFVVGYGLDYDEKFRNLPYIGILKPEVYGGTSADNPQSQTEVQYAL